MVYTQFVVESDDRFGDYNACNPNNQTGVFECQTWENGTGIPKQCAAGYDIEHQDCLNGTLLSNVHINAPPDSKKALGMCCDSCSNNPKCGGWTLMPSPSSSSSSLSSSSVCNVLKNDKHLREWNNAQVDGVGCKSAWVDPDAFACWYADPQLNISFTDVCDRTKCSCTAITKQSVGREQEAMCWHPDPTSTSLSSTLSSTSTLTLTSAAAAASGGPPKESRWIDYISGLGCIMNGTWYSTRKEGECAGNVIDDTCWWRLAEQHRTVNASCVDDRVIGAVEAKRPECWKHCPFPQNRTTACYLDCLFQTLIGNATIGIHPMSRKEIVAPFEKAFLPVEQGGCPEA